MDVSADRDRLAAETADYIANELGPQTAQFHAQPDVHVFYVDDRRPPTEAADIKAALLDGTFWISWMDDRVTAAMTAIHGPYQDHAATSL